MEKNRVAVFKFYGSATGSYRFSRSYLAVFSDYVLWFLFKQGLACYYLMIILGRKFFILLVSWLFGMARKKSERLSAREVRQIKRRKAVSERRRQAKGHMSAFKLEFNKLARFWKKVYGRIACDAAGIVPSDYNISEAARLTGTVHEINLGDKHLAEAIRDVLKLVRDNDINAVRSNYPIALPSLCAYLDDALYEVKCNLEFIQQSDLTKALLGVDNLESRVDELTRADDEAVLVLKQWHDEYRMRFPDHAELAKSINALSPNLAFEDLVRQDIVELRDVSLQVISGVPYDFYEDIAHLIKQVGVVPSIDVLQSISEMVAENLQRSGYTLFVDAVLNVPERVLPDPEVFDTLVKRAKLLHDLGGSPQALDCFYYLTNKGATETQAFARLGSLGKSVRHFELVRRWFDDEPQLVEQAALHPEFFEAFDVLESAGYDEETVMKFLLEFGSYAFRDTTFAREVVRLQRKQSVVQTLVDNALYFCCGEASEDMLRVAQQPGGHRFLEQYILFVERGESNKQLAFLQFLHTRDAPKGDFLEDIVCMLNSRDDAFVGFCLQHDDAMARIEQGPSEEYHRVRALTDLRCHDTIARYNLVPDIAQLDPEALERLDCVLEFVQGTTFEPIALNHVHLRRKIIDYVCEHDDLTSRLRSLPGNDPYVEVSRIFEPAAKNNQEYDFKRIVLIALDTHPDKIEYLENEFGRPIVHYHVDRVLSTKNAICENDVVVYETNWCSHGKYFFVKNHAVRRKAKFVHSDCTNKERIAATIHDAYRSRE